MTRPMTWWISQAVPFAVIFGLLTAAFSFELAPVGAVVNESSLGRRDRMYAIAAADAPGELVMAGAGGKIVKSSDDGKTWAVASTGTTANLQDLIALGDKRLVAAGNAGTFIYSEDSGSTWKAAKTPPPDDIVKVMALALQPGENRPWAVAHFGAILASNDRGATWERVAPKEDVIWNDIAFSSPSTGWVVGEYGRILRSADGGKSWVAVPSPLKSSLSAVAFKDEANGIIVGTEGAVLVTRDGGTSWRRVECGSKEHLYDVVVSGERWIATGNKGAIVSGAFDGGPGAPIPVTDIGNAWHTKVVPAGERMYLAGAVSGVVEQGKFRAFR
jgi:photosystem II stability/assembly factor-like uncharacterized protein